MVRGLILLGLLALAAPAHGLEPGERFKAMAAHAQSFQLWIRERYPHPPITQKQLLNLPRPDISVQCGKAGCRDQLKAFDRLFDTAIKLPTCRGFPSYAALRLMDGRGAQIGVIYITSAQPTVIEIDSQCYDTKHELEFVEDGDVFGGLLRWVK